MPRLRSSIATFRLTAAGVRASRRAAAEKLELSAVRTHDSRLARVSRGHLQWMLESYSIHSQLILREIVVIIQSGNARSNRHDRDIPLQERPERPSHPARV